MAPMKSGVVLIVEDDVDSRALLEIFLTRHGYKTALAESAAAAFAYFESNPLPALVLLDLSMPVTPGESVLQKMREDPQLQSVPIVVTSGWDHVEEIAEVLGANDCMRKPYDLPRLLKIVAKYALRVRELDLI